MQSAGYEKSKTNEVGKKMIEEIKNKIVQPNKPKEKKMIYEIAKKYFDLFGFNLIPLAGKKPIIKWDEWQEHKQTEDDLKKMSWNHSTTGTGGICGINNLRCIDIDGITDYENVKRILRELGLPEDYYWVVKSGNGFHIWIIIDAGEFETTAKAVYNFLPKDDSLCDHLEVRWKNCQTALPPSQHPNGKRYEFINGEPNEKPAVAALSAVTGMLKKYFKVPEQKTTQEFEYNKLNVFDEQMVKSAAEFLSGKLPADCYDEWMRIGFALASQGEKGRKYFVEMSLNNSHYNDTEEQLNAKFTGFLSDKKGEVTLGTLFKIAADYGWKRPDKKFWDKSNDKIYINRFEFIEFLQENGFFRYEVDGNNILVRITDNRVKQVEPFEIKSFTKNYLKGINNAGEDISGKQILESVIKGNNVYFTQGLFEFFDAIEIEFARDTIDKSYVFFKNGFVEVTADEIILKDYKELQGMVWVDQIIDRDFSHTDYESVFDKLLLNICRGDLERYFALKSGIGYLLHRYKDPSRAKAVIFLDENLSEGAFGRSGKSLVGKAIGKFRKVVIIDGRNFKFEKNFAFQSVALDTEILFFNDVGKTFRFDKLFAIISDGITVEKKNKDEVNISFGDAPKILIATNYSIKGTDDSTVARQFLVEFSDYYNKEYAPVDDFGKLFFEAWNEEEWVRFDNAMLYCLQLYLKDGLKSYEYAKLTQKKLIDMTCEEFAEFTEKLEHDKEYDKKELHQAFKDEYPDYSDQKQNTFTKWLKIYAANEGLDLKQWRVNKEAKIQFCQKTKK